MIFRKLTLNNYRQYKEIEFDFSSEINVIEAENGIGKSTFMSSIIFALYGIRQVNKSGLIEDMSYMANEDNVVKEKNTLSFIENDTIATLVIESRAENEIYEVKRTLNNRRYVQEMQHKNFDELNYSNFESVETRKILNTHGEKVDDAIIREMLPANIAPLLFFDGERINSIESVINTNRKQDSFKNEVEKILNIEKFEEIKSLISRTASALNKDMTKEADDRDIDELQIQSNKLEENIEAYKNESFELENKLKKIEFEILDLQDILRTNDKSVELQKERDRIKADLATTKDLKEKTREQLLELVWNEGPKISSTTIFEKVNNVISSGQSIYEITGMEQKAVDSILTNSKCICGKTIDSEMRSNLKELRETLPPESFESMLKSEVANAINIDDVERKYADLRIEFRDTISRNNELELELNEISEAISAIGVNNVQMTEEKLSNCIAFEEKYKKSISELDGKIQSETNILNNQNVILEDKLKSKNTNKLNMQAKKTLDETAKYLGDKINTKKGNIRSNLQEKVNYNIKQLMRDEVEVYLNKNLTPIVAFKAGSTSPSSGQNVMISLAYLLGLIQIAREQSEQKEGNFAIKNITYPIVMDGVTAKLDINHTNTMVENILKANTQVIFLANDQMLVQLKASINNVIQGSQIDDEIITLKRDKDTNITYKVEK